MKICTRCKKKQELSCYSRKGYTSKGNIRYRGECRNCVKDYHKNYYNLNRESEIKRVSEYKKTERGAELNRLYYVRKTKRDVDSLSDNYIKHLIRKGSGLKSNDIPSNIIETKRIIIKLKREIK